MLTIRRSIRASRKRKLNEVYCVATQVDALPLVDPIAENSQLTNAEESKFYDDNAVLKYAPYFFAALLKTPFSSRKHAKIANCPTEAPTLTSGTFHHDAFLPLEYQHPPNQAQPPKAIAPLPAPLEKV